MVCFITKQTHRANRAIAVVAGMLCQIEERPTLETLPNSARIQSWFWRLVLRTPSWVQGCSSGRSTCRQRWCTTSATTSTTGTTTLSHRSTVITGFDFFHFFFYFQFSYFYFFIPINFFLFCLVNFCIWQWRDINVPCCPSNRPWVTRSLGLIRVASLDFQLKC